MRKRDLPADVPLYTCLGDPCGDQWPPEWKPNGTCGIWFGYSSDGFQTTRCPQCDAPLRAVWAYCQDGWYRFGMRRP